MATSGRANPLRSKQKEAFVSDDPRIIQDAYAQELRSLFAHLVENRTLEAVGQKPADSPTSAVDKFKRGLAIARESRDLALDIVSQTA